MLLKNTSYTLITTRHTLTLSYFHYQKNHMLSILIFLWTHLLPFLYTKLCPSPWKINFLNPRIWSFPALDAMFPSNHSRSTRISSSRRRPIDTTWLWSPLTPPFTTSPTFSPSVSPRRAQTGSATMGGRLAGALYSLVRATQNTVHKGRF